MEHTLPLRIAGRPLAPTAALPPIRILIVENNESARRELQGLLRDDPRLRPDAAGGLEEALGLLAGGAYALVLTGAGGADLLREVGRHGIAVPVIVVGEDPAGAGVALDLGAYDFLAGPIDHGRLHAAIRRALRERALREELAGLRARQAPHESPSKSPRMHAIFELVRTVACTDATVMIEGEAGTGKERTARAIHRASPDRTGPFVAVNCTALPESLLESELFGHEPGAFAGAVGRRRGRIEAARGGALYLDEVGDVPPALQDRLLRLLRERRFQRVGGSEDVGADVRVIASSGRNLRRLVAQGKFDETLYDRLHEVRIELPPLRARPEDVPLLAAYFVGQRSRPGEPQRQISPRAMEALLAHRWPGNVRELENAVERACVTARDGVIQADNLPPEVAAAAAPRPPCPVDLDRPLPAVLRDAVDAIERQYIGKALKKARGNVSRCARICGMSRRSITGKIAEYKMDKSVFK